MRLAVILGMLGDVILALIPLLLISFGIAAVVTKIRRRKLRDMNWRIPLIVALVVTLLEVIEIWRHLGKR